MSQKYILFIPGYYGSVLKEKDSGKVRWAQASNFFFSQLGIADDIPGTRIGSSKKLVVDGILKNVKVLPSIWDVDSYGKTLRQLEGFAESHNMKLVSAPYDWRDDFNICLSAIDDKISNLQLRPDDELYIVAHSLGALLIAYYLRYGAQDVDSAVENWEGLKHIKKAALIAPPLHGLMILFRDIEDGTSLGVNRKLLSGRDYSSFKSSYFFLPPKNEDLGFDKNKNLVSIGIHDIDNWEKNLWGPFKYAKTHEKKAVREYLEKYLSRSEKFHNLLRAPVKVLPNRNIPLLHLRGLGQKTKEIATYRLKKNHVKYSFKNEGQVEGDGTVTEKSGKPLDFFKTLDFQSIDIRLGHLDILVKAESQMIIQDFLKK